MPQLALLICIFFICYLFWTDRKNNSEHSSALWIPFAWMFIAGSRYVSSWLALDQSITVSSDTYSEGSPVDSAAFALLIAAGVLIVYRRKIDWGVLFKQNKWILLYFLYCGISIMWTDAPFVSFKRLIKDVGNLVMVLIILTERQPYEAAGVILKRLAFTILPLSVLFIRFYGDLGRGYDPEGGMMYTGVAHQKNGLGKDCLIIGIYFAWHYLLKQKDNFKIFSKDNILNYILIVMLIWLLYMAHSATSLACLLAAVCILLISRIKSINQKPERIITFLLAIAALFIILETTLDISDFIIRALGRDPTLTNRTGTWQMLTEMVTNPLLGAGYMNFWSGERMTILWGKIGANIVQAHNGYVEQYLNLGYIGVAFIVAIILSGLFNVRRHLSIDYPSAVFRLCFIVSAILYNYTEASFYGINNIWILLLFAVFVPAPTNQTYESATTSLTEKRLN